VKPLGRAILDYIAAVPYWGGSEQMRPSGGGERSGSGIRVLAGCRSKERNGSQHRGWREGGMKHVIAGPRYPPLESEGNEEKEAISTELL